MIINNYGGGGISSGDVQSMITSAITSETARTESTYLKEHQSLSAYSTTEDVEAMVDAVDDKLSAYTTTAYTEDMEISIAGVLTLKEDTSNKVTAISSASTDTQYASAKCVYDLIGNVGTLLSNI